MERPPLPVDVNTTWWDYFVDSVGVVSGLATAGALLVAVITIRRQSDDARRKQAARVVVSVKGQPEDENWDAEMTNASDLPIYHVQMRYELYDMEGRSPYSEGYGYPRGNIILQACESYASKVYRMDCSHAPDHRRNVLVLAQFVDAGGFNWERDSGGTLKLKGRNAFGACRRRGQLVLDVE